MSQAANHVKWCLAKAQKQQAEAVKLGKAPKHRGLVRVATSEEGARRNVEKAEHDLKGMLLNAQAGFSDWSVNAAFYCMYHCMLAILTKHGYESGNQTCTVAAVEYLREEGVITLDEKFTNMLKPKKDQDVSVIDLREEYTYGFKIEVKQSELDILTKACRELLFETKKIVFA